MGVCQIFREAEAAEHRSQEGALRPCFQLMFAPQYWPAAQTLRSRNSRKIKASQMVLGIPSNEPFQDMARRSQLLGIKRASDRSSPGSGGTDAPTPTFSKLVG
jgi:hypothetical protein